MDAIVKRPGRATQPGFEGYVLAMFLLWASRPCKEKPDETGAYFIGDVGGSVPEQSWKRLTPYSLAERA